MSSFTLPIEKRANFDLVRYSNCWEDADILIQALDVKEGGVYLSIASAGDNSLSLLGRNPAKVLAIDLNLAQLACLELKKIVFANLTYEETLQFLGISTGIDRIVMYKKISGNLSKESQKFWNGHQELVRKGIIHIGKFENYFRLFRNWILPLMHPKEKITKLLLLDNETERTKFYHEQWNNQRWRFFFKIFFSQKLMGLLGRDSEFFRYVEGTVADRLLERTKYALTVLPTNGNPYLEYILTGNFKKSLPFYLRKENFVFIRSNLNRLVIFRGNLSQALGTDKELKFDGFNLSDIFEYMSEQEYHTALIDLLASCKKKARLVYWNMLANRNRPESLSNTLHPLGEEAQNLFLKDRAFFYQSLVIEEVK